MFLTVSADLSGSRNFNHRGVVGMLSMVEVIDGGSVAEKSSVWCSDGSVFMIRRTLGQNPISSGLPRQNKNLDVSQTDLMVFNQIKGVRGNAKDHNHACTAEICRLSFAPPVIITAR